MRKSVAYAALTAVSFSLLLAGCSGQTAKVPDGKAVGAKAGANSSKSKPAGKATASATSENSGKVAGKPRGVALYDLSHSEIFQPSSQDALGFSKARSVIENAGLAFHESRDPISESLLKDVDVVILAGPMMNVTDEEIGVLSRYVMGGGNLFVTLHLAEPARKLSGAFGFDLSNAIVAQDHDMLSDDRSPMSFVATSVVPHAVTKSVTGIAVRGAWTLRPANNSAKAVVSTASDAWFDANRNDQPDPGELQGEQGIIGVTALGKGKAVFSSDDAVLTNETIGAGGNQRLLENSIEWFLTGK